MKNAFRSVVRNFSALYLLSGVAVAWMLWPWGASAKGWSALKDLLPENNAETIYESGCRDFQTGARQVAIDEFTKAIELDPSFAPAYEARAAARFKMKDYAGAIPDCDKVIGLAHDDERIYLIKGACCFYLHQIKAARSILSTAIALNPDDPMARDVRGVTLLELRDWDQATPDFTKAIQLNPNDARAYYGRAAAEFFLHQYEKSLVDASDSIELLDDSITPDAYGLRAEIKSHLKDRAGALADANSKIQLNPSDASGYLTRATIELQWDDFSGASNDLHSAIGINPTNSTVRLDWGVWELKQGNLQAALADFRKGLQFDSEAFQLCAIYAAMGYAYAGMGQWQQALEAFRKTMTFDSPPEDVRFEAFLLESRMGQSQQAKKELAAYIQSIPAAKARDWSASIAHFLAGTLSESDFIAQAASTAARPTDIALQTGDAWYFAGMTHLLAGDKAGALERFKKCLKVGDDNSDEYLLARSFVGR